MVSSPAIAMFSKCFADMLWLCNKFFVIVFAVVEFARVFVVFVVIVVIVVVNITF